MTPRLWRGAVLALLVEGEVAAQLTQAEKDQLLDLQNAARASVSPAAYPYLSALEWDATVASVAQQEADACPTAYNPGPYGENLAFVVTTPAAAVNLWLSQEPFYHYATDTCDAGQTCGNYTQVVWAGTTSLGCGKKTNCFFGAVWVCFYDPPGNFVGLRPYLCDFGQGESPCSSDNLFFHGFEQGTTLGWSVVVGEV